MKCRSRLLRLAAITLALLFFIGSINVAYSDDENLEEADEVYQEHYTEEIEETMPEPEIQPEVVEEVVEVPAPEVIEEEVIESESPEIEEEVEEESSIEQKEVVEKVSTTTAFIDSAKIKLDAFVKRVKTMKRNDIAKLTGATLGIWGVTVGVGWIASASK